MTKEFRKFVEDVIPDLKTDFDTCICQVCCVCGMLEFAISGYNSIYKRKKRRIGDKIPEKGCYGTYCIDNM